MSALVLASGNDLKAMMEFAEKLAVSDLLPKAFAHRPANVLYAIEYGRTIGVPAMTAILGIHVIEGKPTASSALISGLVRRAGHKLRVTGDDKSATATIVRSDDPDFPFAATWTIERARTAGLTGKEVWKKYAAAMLKARAITEAARDACQEALFGLLYTPEELGVNVDADGNPVIAASGDYVMGHVVEADAGQIARWGDALAEARLEDLRAVAVEVNLASAWSEPSYRPGSPTLREVLVRRLGDEIRDARSPEALREVWKLVTGAGATDEEYTFERDGETIVVLLGEFCRNRGEKLAKPTVEPQEVAPPVEEWPPVAQAISAEAISAEVFDAELVQP